VGGCDCREDELEERAFERGNEEVVRVACEDSDTDVGGCEAVLGMGGGEVTVRGSDVGGCAPSGALRVLGETSREGDGAKGERGGVTSKRLEVRRGRKNGEDPDCPC
jgi:hypothetical protein